MHKFRTQNALFWCFCFKNFKNYSHILNQNTRISQVLKFCEKRKCEDIGTKISYLDLFRLELEKKKTIVVFKISIVKIATLQNFVKE